MQNKQKQLVKKLLQNIRDEYNDRYQWSQTYGECMALLFNIQSSIKDAIFSAYKNSEDTLSSKEILDIVTDFKKNWKNTPTDCDDTDGNIYITSIYLILEDNL